jgi:hypothetical protein
MFSVHITAKGKKVQVHVNSDHLVKEESVPKACQKIIVRYTVLRWLGGVAGRPQNQFVNCIRNDR